MKLFVVAFLSTCLAVSAARACSKSKKCPKNWKCAYTAKDRSKGTCKYNTMHTNTGGIDYNRANRAFSSADVDHNKKITFGGAYRALHQLVPGAPEKMLDKLTKTGDKNRDGSISYGEFIAMYKVLVDRTMHKGKPGDKCANNPCGSDQMCRNCKNTKGYCCESVSTVNPNKPNAGALTSSERAQVNNIYTALNTNKDKGVSRQEFYQLLMAVRATMGKDTKLYGEVYNYIMIHGDTNKDKIVSYSEFLKACQSLKSKDPKGFPIFLKSAVKLKPLKLGDPCVRYGSAKKACPKGSACTRTQVQVQYRNSKNADGSPKTYAAYRYFCAAATTTQKAVTNIMAGGTCTYGYCKSGCRRCAKNLSCRRKATHYGQTATTGVCAPRNCKDCTKAHGVWMSNRCYFGSPGVADGVMFTTTAQCEHYEAAKKAKCYSHKDCKSCITKSKHSAGPLCGWSTGWGGHGSCQANTGSYNMPLNTAVKQCAKPVIVHGRE